MSVLCTQLSAYKQPDSAQTNGKKQTEPFINAIALLRLTATGYILIVMFLNAMTSKSKTIVIIAIMLKTYDETNVEQNFVEKVAQMSGKSGAKVKQLTMYSDI
jgi:hypothetical protein